MTTFLQDAAKLIFESRNSLELKDTCIVVPSKRAALVLKRNLALLYSEPVFAPQIQSIDDYVIKNSGLQLVDNLELHFLMFELFKEIDPDQTFEKFLTIAPTILADFENIEFGMLQEPQKLFQYMSESQSIERWELGEDFNSSDISKSYFDFFDLLFQLYTKLNFYLLDNKKCYRGLAYKTLAGKVQSTDFITHEFTFFVGLNALTVSEEAIIKSLIKAKKAGTIWDSDDYYMNGSTKAGKKLKQYKTSGEYNDWNFQNDFLSNSAKEINIFELNNNITQVKLAKTLAQKHDEASHVIVVLDEGIFKPLMLNLPENDLQFNISIGYNLSNSNLLKLILIINDNLGNFYKKIPVSYIKNLFLNHLFTDIYKKYKSSEDLEKLKKEIIETKLFAVGNNYFQILNHSLPEFAETLIFHNLEGLALVNLILTELEPIIEKFDLIEQSAFNFLKSKLEILQTKVKLGFGINNSIFKTIIKELIRAERVPFEGDKNSKLQIMSMLETRCLDFETVSILSFNEGLLPSMKKSNSFFPFDARKYFNLPVYYDQDAIMSYHFWRLMQRAQHINFVYVKGSGDVIGSKEKSSFIKLVEEELKPNNPQIQIKYPDFSFEENSEISENAFEICIPKNQSILQKIDIFLKEKGHSPTSLTAYFQCTLKFYFKYIENIKAENEVSKSLQFNDIGNIFHKIMEHLDNEYTINKKYIDDQVLGDFYLKYRLLISDIIQNDYKKVNFEQGLNKVFFDILDQLISKYIDFRIRNFEKPYKILANEQKLKATFPAPYNQYLIRGTVDKIELHNGGLVMIDFKTGEVKINDLKINSKQSVEYSFKEREKLLQLSIYNYLINNDIDFKNKFGLDENILKSVKSKIISSRNFSDDLILENAYQDDLSIFLKEHIMEILSVDFPFVQTNDLKKCQNCDFSNVCNRSQST